MKNRFFLIALFLLVFASGCGGVISKAAGRVADNLTSAVLKENDPQLVKEGAPTLMLLMEGMLEGRPDDERLLNAAAQMFSAYNSAFVAGKDAERSKILSAKAKDYAFRAMSARNACFKENKNRPFQSFEPCAKTFKKEDVPQLSLVIGSWAGWIQAHSDDWDAVADVAKVRVLAERLVELDENYYYGSPHLYIGVLYTILPPALGGRTEEGRAEFEKAISIGKGHMLTAHLMYARQVAVPTMDKKLFDQLMKHMRETPADVIPELTLLNTIAKSEAEKLAAESENWFTPTE